MNYSEEIIGIIFFTINSVDQIEERATSAINRDIEDFSGSSIDVKKLLLCKNEIKKKLFFITVKPNMQEHINTISQFS